MSVAALNGRNGGRPSTLSKSLALQICNELAKSPVSLMALLQSRNDWPDYNTVMNWRESKRWFSAMLWNARERQADFLAQNCIDLEQDLLRKQDGVSMAAVQAHKVVMEQRRWYTGKVLKRLYGDDSLAVNVDARTAVVVGDEQIRELRGRLGDARKLVKDAVVDVNARSPEQFGNLPEKRDA